MVACRVMFVFMPLFLSLIITILTAPVPDNQLVTDKNTNETTEAVFYKDETIESNESSEEKMTSTPGEYKEEIKTMLEVVTSDFLLVNATEIVIDVHDNLQALDRLLFDKQGELSITTTSTQIPQSSQISAPDTAADEQTTSSIQ